jgi:hypothetical protein
MGITLMVITSILLASLISTQMPPELQKAQNIVIFALSAIFALGALYTYVI